MAAATDKQVSLYASEPASKIDNNNAKSIELGDLLIPGDILINKSGDDGNIYSPILINNSTIHIKIGPNKKGIIISPLNISDSIITDNIDFSDFIFQGDVTFSNVTFQHNFSSIRTTFNNLVLYNCTFYGDVNFSRSNITQMATFDRSKFMKGANFDDTEFLGEATFKNCEFKRATGFRNLVFKSASTFNDANFSDAVDFDGREFMRSASFVNCNFTSASFEVCTFREGADFKESCFAGSARFCNATFKGIANLRGVIFLNDTDFSSSLFSSHADFSYSHFNKDASFMDAEFKDEVRAEGGQFLGILNLNRTTYKQFYVKSDSIEYLTYNETAYNALITNLRNLGLFEDANNFYFRFMCKKGQEMNNDILYRGKTENLLSAIIYFLAWVSFGFGMRPDYPFRWSIGLILGFTLFWYRFYPDVSGGMLEKHGSGRGQELNGNFIRALTFSISIFLSGTKVFIDPPMIPDALKKSNHLVTKAYLAERTLGAAFFLLFFLAVSKTLIAT